MREQIAGSTGKEWADVGLKVWIGMAILVLLFGDRALRVFFHLSFFNSLIIWAGSLALFLLGGVVIAHTTKT